MVARPEPARTTSVLSRIVDAMASVTVVGRPVDDVFAGVLLGEAGSVTSLPGLPGDALLDGRSRLLETLRAQQLPGVPPTSFLWARDRPPSHRGHVRVTCFGLAVDAVPGVHGIVLLSRPPDLRGLTRRELEVLGYMLDGSSNGQIACALVVTPRTIATHVEHILSKLSSPSRTHAAVRAQRDGLYIPPPVTRVG